MACDESVLSSNPFGLSASPFINLLDLVRGFWTVGRGGGLYEKHADEWIMLSVSVHTLFVEVIRISLAYSMLAYKSGILRGFFNTGGHHDFIRMTDAVRP